MILNDRLWKYRVVLLLIVISSAGFPTDETLGEDWKTLTLCQTAKTICSVAEIKSECSKNLLSSTDKAKRIALSFHHQVNGLAQSLKVKLGLDALKLLGVFLNVFPLPLPLCSLSVFPLSDYFLTVKRGCFLVHANRVSYTPAIHLQIITCLLL